MGLGKHVGRLRAAGAAALLAGAAITAGAYPGLSTGSTVVTGPELMAQAVGPSSGSRVETPVASHSPVTGVLESVVRVRIPLPASVGAHPAACDWLSYLRYRSRGGPAVSARADRILVAQPGVLEGAGAFDSVARNTVAAAARLGRHVEFWALDRRSNCLEDHTGIAAASVARDLHVAVDYYYRHRAIEGRTFAGFLGNGQVGWLANVGLEQTLRDQYDLLREELPSPTLRRQKVLCGGHSLGGLITGFFAVWDFDGNPATASDAGSAQCAGYFALDTIISTSTAALTGGSAAAPSALPTGGGSGFTATQLGLRTGTAPRTLSAPALINAETMNLLAIAGVGAATRPGDRSDLINSLPGNANITATTRVLFSKNAFVAATGRPSVGQFNLTNAATLGGLLDDDSEPLAILQSSVGFFGGTGRIVSKNFPVNELKPVLNLPGLGAVAGNFGKEKLAIPDQPGGPLYTWRNYDQLDAAHGPIPTAADGTPFTTPAKEVTDIAELARSLSEQPLDFTEQYFPTKLITDIFQAGAPAIRRFTLHPEGIAAHPVLTLLGGDGVIVGHVPAGVTPVIAPGYQHLDVLTAAPVQNNGRPEVVSTHLAAFAARP